MISSNKIEAEKKHIIEKCGNCKGFGCSKCYGYCSFIDKMASAEIPVDYWFRNMKEFYGDQFFKDVVLNYIGLLDKNFLKGTTLFFVGHRGTGKTMGACAILKEALLKNYSVWYTTMVDVVNRLMGPSSYQFRQAIKEIDFVVIDEVDQRFFPSPNSQELFGNHFENILRTRVQNRLPTILCTNSEDISVIFGGQFEESFASLRSQFVKVLRVGGKDARKSKERI